MYGTAAGHTQVRTSNLLSICTCVCTVQGSHVLLRHVYACHPPTGTADPIALPDEDVSTTVVCGGRSEGWLGGMYL